MDEYEFLLTNIGDIYNNEGIFLFYKDNFQRIIHDVEPKTLLQHMKEYDEDELVLASLYIGSLFVRREFMSICEYVKGINLEGRYRHLDYFNSRVLKYYYPSLKYTGNSIEVLYRLYATNREYGNHESVKVLTNCLLDYHINMGIYLPIYNNNNNPRLIGISNKIKEKEQRNKNNNMTIVCCDTRESCIEKSYYNGNNSENARYFLYHGIIHMVNGEYKEALCCFSRADVLQKKRGLELIVLKHTIICRLLVGDFVINCRYSPELEPYFSLVRCVKRADLMGFYKLLEKYREEYFKLNLWFVVRRLVKNLLREGVRKISMCYSRISIEEISRILGTDARVLLEEALKNKFIDGYVQDGIYYGGNRFSGKEMSYGIKIRELISVKDEISKMMHYPEIIPLTYETQERRIIKY